MHLKCFYGPQTPILPPLIARLDSYHCVFSRRLFVDDAVLAVIGLIDLCYGNIIIRNGETTQTHYAPVLKIGSASF
jgi:hypothetical protein